MEKLQVKRNLEGKKERGHPDLNRGPLDLQSNALPLSYTPNSVMTFSQSFNFFLQALLQGLHVRRELVFAMREEYEKIVCEVEGDINPKR